jgi:hypothetical protein
MSAALAAPAFALAALLTAAPSARAQAFHLHLGYDGRFGIFGKVLDAQVELKSQAQGFDGAARLHSAGLLAIFKKIEERAGGTGQVAGREVLPGVFRYDNPGERKYRRVEVAWKEREVVTTAAPAIQNWGDPPATPAQKLEAADPLTQVMRFALAGPQGPDCRGVARFFDGMQRYDLEFVSRTPVRHDDREKRLGLTEVVRCEVRYHEISGFRKRRKSEHADQGMIGPATLTFGRLGPSGPWLISAMDAESHWGHASVVLTRVSEITG